MSRISPVKMPLAPVSTFSRPEGEEASSSSTEVLLVGKVASPRPPRLRRTLPYFGRRERGNLPGGRISAFLNPLLSARPRALRRMLLGSLRGRERRPCRATAKARLVSEGF